MSQKYKASPKPSPKNTLFNYFSKNTGNTPQNSKNSVEKTKASKNEVKLSGKKLEFGKRTSTQDSSDDENILSNNLKKRKIVESDGENNEENTDNNSPKKAATSSAITKKRPLKESEDETEKPKVGTPAAKLAKFAEQKTPSTKPKAARKLHAVEDDDSNQGVGIEIETKIWQHETLEFMQPANIRDTNKNRPNHPDYDPRTLFVPDSFLKTCTPGHLQWWTLKALYYDCIFFFKVGKFYELYHQDAVIGVKELGFTFMKGEFAHSGFPESAYEKMSSTLVERGYKVARVEQTETPNMMEKRCERENKRSKFDKVVRREVCQVTNLGTQLFSTGQCSMAKGQYSSNANYLLAIAEAKSTKSTNRYGIAFVDTSIGDFTLGEFDDDQQCSRLLALLSLYTPVVILHERTGMYENTAKIIKNINAQKEKLTNEKQFWIGSRALKFLAETVYNDKDDGEKSWPDVLKDMQCAYLTPAPSYVLALKALGGCLWYLKHNLMDQHVLSLATFKRYTPPDLTLETSQIAKHTKKTQKHMMLDAITLSNLNINGSEGSLFSKLDYCCTQFGKRLLLEYICSPCSDIHEIRSRQEAVRELTEDIELLTDCRGLLSVLHVDLERSVVQIHQLGNKKIMQNHPSGRAILYEAETYGKNKITDFAAALNAFDQLMNLPRLFKDCKSSMLRTLTQINANGGEFLDLSKNIEKFKSSFDIEQAKKTGYIIPGRNADDEYDDVLNEIDELEQEINIYLKQQEKVLGTKLVYFGSDRKRYQIEVPESHCKKIPSSYVLESSKGKGKNAVKRYVNDETKNFLKRMQELEEKKKKVLDDFGRKIFEKFSLNYLQYKRITNLAAKLDVLASFAEYSRNLTVSCMPECHDYADRPGESFLVIEDGLHPLMNPIDYIPNSINIGVFAKNFELITGSNMGGKSTLMREVALLCILAQTGCFVPAESMKFTLVDRIFTRLGANDNIFQNQSTFLVELNETAIILKHCTFNSLIILDELGRGTSTYDGTAIARAVANFLADKQCRTMFSTHYHSLVEDFQDDDRIHLGHMACVVENENSEDITKENVTFLYKYTSGSSSRSFGFNAAKLSGIDHNIIRRAYEISKKVEAESLKHRIKTKVLQGASDEEIKTLVVKFKKCLA